MSAGNLDGRWIVRVRYENDAGSTSVALDPLGVMNEILDALMRDRYPDRCRPRLRSLVLERDRDNA